MKELSKLNIISSKIKYIPEDEVKSRLLLNVVITQSATIFQLFPSKDQSLLIGGNAKNRA
jgi:hypothetical protein